MHRHLHICLPPSRILCCKCNFGQLLCRLLEEICQRKQQSHLRLRKGTPSAATAWKVRQDQLQQAYTKTTHAHTHTRTRTHTHAHTYTHSRTDLTWQASISRQFSPSRTSPSGQVQFPVSPLPRNLPVQPQVRPSTPAGTGAGLSTQVACEEQGKREHASESEHFAVPSTWPDEPIGQAQTPSSFSILGNLQRQVRPATSPAIGAALSTHVECAPHGLVSHASISSHVPSLTAYPSGHLQASPSPSNGGAHMQYRPSFVLLKGAGRS